MCGRFNLFSPPESIRKHFNLNVAPEIQVDYNIHPGGDILAIMPEAKAELLHWGLIPFWAKDRKLSYNLINARLETVADKPSFRAAFKQRHVIIPATGYYEWRPIENGTKQAYHITRPDPTRPFSVLRVCGSIGNKVRKLLIHALSSQLPPMKRCRTSTAGCRLF